MKAKVFVPSHITGFFQVHHNEDISRMGSLGVGVALEKGMITEISLSENGEGHIGISLNGKTIGGHVTRRAVEIILGDSIIDHDIKIDHQTELPMSQGFGLSGAGALGTAIGVNRALALNLTAKQCGMAAHRAEVENRTGLGDVIAQIEGGLVIRTKPGAPGVGGTDRIFSEKYMVAFLLAGELETAKVLRDSALVERINKVGGRIFMDFMISPSEDNFMAMSRSFASKTGLMGKKVQEGVEILNKKGIISSMGMLGNTIFTLTDDPEMVAGELDYQSIISKIDNCGARLHGK